MNQLFFHLLIQSAIILHVRAGSGNTDSDGSISSFQPSLAIVIGILCLMFSLTFFLLMYAKFCQRRASSVRGDPENHPALTRSRSRFSGIDKTVIESLPFFRFSSLRGSKEGLECAVCLSKFEDIEILRLLPKCQHAFHINCIDHWLEKHSSCPLCRHKVNPDDQTIFTYSNSLRILANQSDHGEESNIEVFVQREEEHHGSSRFSIGSSFRKTGKGFAEEEELPIQQEAENGDQKVYHKHKHKITISDVVFKNRWSNVSSSDLIFLNSEMLGSMSSRRFDSLESKAEQKVPITARAVENEQILNIKEEMERKMSLESKVSTLHKINSVLDTGPSVVSEYSGGNSSHTSKYVNPAEKRSMSEIVGFSRFVDLGVKGKALKEPSLMENNVKEDRRRQLWLPIARRTVKWFVNRETRSQQSQNKQDSSDV